ncbi:hypothetical protein [Legionella erythra]|nr:hypothetical protein [Legionella erythra]
MQDRIKLVRFLENRGFKVHGVITPNDLLWSQLNGEQAAQLDKAFSGYKGRFEGQEFDKQIRETSFVEANPFLEGMVKYDPEANRPGCSYAEAFKACSTIEKLEEAALPGHLLERSSYTKVFVDHLATKLGFVDPTKQSGQERGHTKGLMLDFFLHHKPEWVSSILVVDDNIDVIQGIDKLDKKPSLPISTLTIKKIESEDVYDAAIEKHLKMDPHFSVYYKIQQLIDAHIKHLQSTRYNPFLSSPKAKIEALQLLQDDLRNAFNTKEEVDIPKIINDWQAAIKFKSTSTKTEVPVSTVISQHRNVFFAEHRDKLTSTQQFVEWLKTQFKPESGKDILIIPTDYSIN